MSNLHFLKVKVVRIDEDRHRFIVEHEGKIYQVSQLAFQRQQPKPDFIGRGGENPVCGDAAWRPPLRGHQDTEDRCTVKTA